MSSFEYYVIVAVLVVLLILMFALKKRRVSSQQHYPENEQLYVGNLSYQVNSHQLKKFFSRFGEIESARVIKNTKTGRSKGFAFVTYSDTKSAIKALRANGQDLRGRALVVRMAKPREQTVG